MRKIPRNKAKTEPHPQKIDVSSQRADVHWWGQIQTPLFYVNYDISNKHDHNDLFYIIEISALWHAFMSANSMGKIPAWASIKLLGVVLRVPVIASVVICWAFLRFHRVHTDPEFLVCPSGFVRGLYHMSMLRWVYKQAFTKFTSLRAFKEFQRFQVNTCIDSTKGKNKLRNYCTELVSLYTQREG